MGRRGPRPIEPVPGDPADLRGFPVMVDQFCEHMGVRGLSAHTIEGRRKALRHLAGWLADRGITRPADVTKPMVERYQRWLFHYRKGDGAPLTFRSQHGRLVAVRAFFRWAARDNRILFNPASEIDLPKVERRLPRHVLTAAEAEQVLAVPDISTAGGLRDRAILEVFYSTGMRRMELGRLRLFDLDTDRHTIHIHQAKGRVDRIVPVGERAIDWTHAYLDQVRPRWAPEPDPGWLFLTADGHPFSGSGLTGLVRGHLQASGVPKTGACHLFRHTMATLMLEAGADLRHIQAMLGHARPETTQIYTQVSIRHLLAIHTATHPANQPRPRRDDDTRDLLDQALHDRDDHDDGDHDDGEVDSGGEVADQELLAAAVDQEIDQENRPNPDSPDPAVLDARDHDEG